MKLVIDDFISELDMDLIDIASTNARITDQTKGLDDLKTNIKNFGLFQPVTVFKKGERYMLLVGQRRFLACKELEWETIPAFIIRPLNSKTQTIVSFGENVHRRKLPIEDSIQACNKLFGEYNEIKTKKGKVKKIAKDLGISEYEVNKYLVYELIPTKVRSMISDGKLAEHVAYRITAAHYPNIKKITEISEKACRMTSAEAQRAADYGKSNPAASIKEIIDYAKNPPPIIELIIHIEPDTNDRLKKTAKRKRVSIESYVKDAIGKQLDDDE